MQTRKSINMGVKNGIRDNVTESELSGLRIINMISRRGMTNNIMTGIINCWASFSEFTVDPIAANKVENRKYPRMKKITK